MKKLTIIILVLFLFSNCKKDKSLKTTVKGIVQEAGSLKPVGGATILLRGRDVNCFSCGTNTVASYSADANGVYSFDFTASEGIGYELGASKNRYYDNINNNIVIDIGEINENKNIVLDPEAYLKIHVKNIQPFDSNDLITVDGDWNCCGAPNFHGTLVDIFVTNFTGKDDLRIRGNKASEVVWFVTKNGVKKTYSDKIYCPAFDTTIHNINY